VLGNERVISTVTSELPGDFEGELAPFQSAHLRTELAQETLHESVLSATLMSARKTGRHRLISPVRRSLSQKSWLLMSPGSRSPSQPGS
jgi:hypothetical protein